MSASTIATHPGRKPARLEDYRTRTRPQLLQEPVVDTRSAFARNIDEIMADFEKPALVIVRDKPRDTHYWRRAGHDFQNDMRRAACDFCNGTGEIWVWIDYAPDPCPNCQLAYVPGGSSNSFPTDDDETMEVPF